MGRVEEANRLRGQVRETITGERPFLKLEGIPLEDGVILDVLGERYSVCQGLREALETGVVR